MMQSSRATYEVGTLREFAEWTKQIVRDRASAQGVPKKWFDNDETARKAATGQVSAEAMVKLLAPGESGRPGSRPPA
jgi:hypothetical protein